MQCKAILAAVLAAMAIPAAPLCAEEQPAAAPSEQTPLEARADQVVAVINGTLAPEDLFTAGFQAAVPLSNIEALSINLSSQFGPAVEVSLLAPSEGTRAVFHIRFESGLAKGRIAIDPAEDNRVSELLITSVDAVAVAGDTPEAITAELAALPGSVNAWFGPLEGGAPVISIGADSPLALGSTFKLYVLVALAEDVKAGRRQWTDVVPLTEKSYPSGQMQDWPKGAPVTLHTLTSMMISISDNTATDQLIKVLGEARILKLMTDTGHANPARNTPFLTTRELFLTKASNGLIDLLRKGQRGDQDAMAVYLTLLASPEKPVTLAEVNAAFANGPKALDIEWFASPADLAKLLAHMRETADPAVFDIMAINPSATPAIKANWDYIGFKGGSEPGVMNLTWLLRDGAGLDHVLTLGWNNPAAVLDEAKLLAIAQRILLLPR